ncbi:MAG: DUF166 domain-containing protein [Promethearchaeota archaeon]
MSYEKNMKVFYIYSGEKQERFIEHMINSTEFCKSCADLCDDCRIPYGSFAGNIVGMYIVPEELPAFIEDPDEYLPETIPSVDVAIVLNVHHDILISIPDLLNRSGVKAVIVPVEDGDWVPLGLQHQMEEQLEEYGIEYAFPRPYCSLRKSNFEIINRFIDVFKIGRPEFEIDVHDDFIYNGDVKITSPCGCAFYVNRELIRYKSKVDKTLKEVISKAHHSYPCNASMNKDVALDEAPLHVGGYIHRKAIYEAIVENAGKGKFKNIEREIEELSKMNIP